MKKLIVDVSGMHCKSCELLLERSIKSAKNVEKVQASHSRGTLEIFYSGSVPDKQEIESIITENGYTPGKEARAPWFHTNIQSYVEILFIALALFGAYMLAKMSGFSFGGFGDMSSPTFGVVFLVGLTAGVSSCMALVGGLILAVSAKWNEEQLNTSKWHRFEPHIYFNIGRIIGFGLFGGLL